jgi:hypothetical protein
MEFQDYNCGLCSRNVEDNMFFECPFNKWCWRIVNIHWNTSSASQDMLIKSRQQFNSRIFRELIMVTGWTSDVIEMLSSLIGHHFLLVVGRRHSKMNLL